VDDTSRGRRGNGLPASDWGALVDLDPRLSEGLLTRLAAAGVAAFVEPAIGADGFTRATTHPDRPLDRLWVDPSRADAAREVVGAEVADLTSLLAEQEPGATAHGLVQPVPRTAARRVLTPPTLPGPPPRTPAVPPPAAAPSPEGAADPDEEFRRIVEGFTREGDSPVPPWPVSEDVDPSPRRRFPLRPEQPEGEDGAPRRRRTDPPPEADLPEWLEPEALEDEGHYVPPPPPPVPRLAPQKVAAALAVVAGVLLMFAPSVLLQDRTDFVFFLGLLLTAGGAAAMVYLMRDAPPTDSGPDDGAVV
jgi:hypothetical protein